MTGGVDYLRESRTKAADLHEAKRLVALEVGNNAVGLSQLDTDRSGEPDNFPAQEWEKYRSLLARHVSDYDWEALAYFYDSVEYARDMTARNPLVRFSDDDLDGLHELRILAEEIRVHLGAEPTGLLYTIGSKRVRYQPDRNLDDPFWRGLYYEGETPPPARG